MSNDLTILCRVTAKIYKESALKATKGLLSNWLLIPGAIAACSIFFVTLQLVFTLFPGMAGGFVLGLIEAALISYYYSWLSDTVRNDRLTLRDMVKFDSSLFIGIISVGFIFFILHFLLKTLLNGFDATFFLLSVQLLLAILFNPIPEVLYTHRFDGMHALSHASQFIRENWIEWFIPFLLFMAPFALFGPYHEGIVEVLIATDPIFPIAAAVRPWLFVTFGSLSLVVHTSFTTILAIVLTSSVGTWFMLFRAHLFLALDTSSRRRRIFQGR